MSVKKIAKVVALAAASAVLMLGIVGCSGGKVAATVGDVKIMEDDVTAQIEQLRKTYDMTDKDVWGQNLANAGQTPEAMRQSVIDSMVEKELIKKAAKENDVTVDKAEVDKFINEMRDQYESDAAWKSALEGTGMTEQEYRDMIEVSLLSERLAKKVCTDVEASDEEVLPYVSMYAGFYFDDARKSSHILFDASDKAKAEEVLAQIKSGAITFEDAAKQYSKDGSGANGGDVGWDCFNQFVIEYTDALKNLDKGMVSGLVESEYGIHIIKCTDQFKAPKEVTSLSQVPADLVEKVREEVKESLQQQAFSEWLENYKESANVVVNDMPSGLPYEVDMSKYTPQVEEGAEGDLDLEEVTDEEDGHDHAQESGEEGSK